jgi:hypothetical protein
LESLRKSSRPLTTALVACAPADGDGRLRVAPWLLDQWLGRVQQHNESRQARLRRQLFRRDVAYDGGLSFSGSAE